jgi:predicted esterase
MLDAPAAVSGAPGAPTSGAKHSLLVVLHGDEGSPGRVFGSWKRAAKEASYLLFAPQCPRAEGCTGSWWRWSGDPRWLMDQLDAIEARYPVDRARVYLSGWSGGATYIGLFAPSFSPRFAAMNLSGGGAPPGNRSTCAACPTPVHYLMGDRNPLFSLAQGTRAYFEGCRHDLTWDGLAGANHAAELRAYTSPEKTRAILAWFSAHPNGCTSGAPADAGAPDGGDGGRSGAGHGDSRGDGSDAGGERSGAGPVGDGGNVPFVGPSAAPPGPGAGCLCAFIGAGAGRGAGGVGGGVGGAGALLALTAACIVRRRMPALGLRMLALGLRR